MPYVFIVVNPMAGGARLQQLERTFEAHLRPPWEYSVHMLAQGEDLTEVIQEQIAAGVDIVVAAGGDGTVRAVASSLVGTDVSLGILPEGTANIVAYDTGIPLRLGEALALITGPHGILPLDAIQVDGAFAFLNVSIGLSAGIIRDTDATGKRRFGMLAYVWSGARNLLAVGVRDVMLTVDGRERRLRATEVLIANCPSLGVPELRPSDDIDPADGVLQVIAFRARHLGDYLNIGRELLHRRPRTRRHVQVIRAEHEVTIRTPESLDVQADGDLIGCTPVTAQLVRGAIRLIVPRGGLPQGERAVL
ncbi:MAG: diacylglycerol/lipid kinase family protein [Anaerolineae bacterium]